MSEVPVKKKHQSGSEKRKKRQEQQNKLNEQLKKTQNLFKLEFSCESKEHQLHGSLSTCSASHTMAADPVEVPCKPLNRLGIKKHLHISHTDQLTVVLRYVTSNGEVAERFLKFLLIQNHKGEELATEILNFCQYNIDVRNLRGQSYDNASNMSGCYNGLQVHIKRINHLAHYVPCAAHSLNLVGVRAAESCVGAISFFGFVQALYNFFSASTHRWAIMLKHLEKGDERKQDSSLVLKRVSDTRWCARADATKALANGYNSFQKALQSIAGDETQTSQAIHEAKCLLNDLGKNENAVMAVFWAAILDRINGRELFDDYETKANEKTDTQYSDENQRVRKGKDITMTELQKKLCSEEKRS
ncbi:Zinc finger MYM-type protein 1 [Eumeta japonica]|uniref:Zinc finger MYM-type protein 1 n=1 Tax=Eumeta variegata TaxID=151549 RepID=A0A4C1Y6L9_EUMVA|nr:Zinc finger MYM-type protein 1 [Eumeta japonica]